MSDADAIQMLNLVDVLDRLKITRTTIYRWIDSGKFPKPIKLSETTNRWLLTDIEKWIAERSKEAA